MVSSSSSSSSDTDSEEAERLRSVAVDSVTLTTAAALNSRKQSAKERDPSSDGENGAPVLKFYQTRAYEILNKYLDETFETVPLDEDVVGKPSTPNEACENSAFRLFGKAPPGLTEKQHCGEVVPNKRRKQAEDINEDSDVFQSSILAAAVDGEVVKGFAEKAVSKALVSWLSRQAEEKEALKKEEERIKLLKVQRGEQWLPSVAKGLTMDKLFDEQLLSRAGKAKVQKPNQNAAGIAPEVGVSAAANHGGQKKKKKKKTKAL